MYVKKKTDMSTYSMKNSGSNDNSKLNLKKKQNRI